VLVVVDVVLVTVVVDVLVGSVVDVVVLSTVVDVVVSGTLVDVVVLSTVVDVVLPGRLVDVVDAPGQFEKSIVHSGVHSRKAPTTELPGQVAPPKSSVSHSSPASIVPLPQRSIVVVVELVVVVLVGSVVLVVESTVVVEVVVDAMVEVVVAIVDVVVTMVEVVVKSVVDVVVAIVLLVVGGAVVVVVQASWLHASPQLVNAPQALFSCGNGSAHLASFTTWQDSCPLPFTFRQRTYPGRPQSDAFSAFVTSTLQAFGKPVLPSSSTSAFTTGFQHCL